VLKTRTRMVSFRLSQDEYEHLMDLSLADSARSVSEFARAALCRLQVGSSTLAEPSVPRLERLEGVVQELAVDLRKLRRLVESLPYPEMPANEEPGGAPNTVVDSV